MSPALLALLAAPAFALDLETPTLVVGEEVTFRATGAPAGESVRFLRGSEGNGPCYAALGGLCLGLTNPRSLGSATADADGVAELTLTLPATVPQVFIGLQAAHGGATPAVSNVASSPILAREGGLVVINDQASYDAAKMLIEIGYLNVEDGAPADIDLPWLEEGRNLDIYSDTVESFRADNAQFDITVGVIRAAAMHTFALPSLTTTFDNVFVLNAPLLETVELDAFASTVGNVEFVDSGAPGATLALPSLELAGAVTLDGTGFATVDLSALTRIQDYIGAEELIVTGNDELVDLHLDNLEFVEDAVFVTDNPSLAALHLPSLVSLYSWFSVERNDALADMTLPGGFPYVYQVVRDNPSLPDCVIEDAFYDAGVLCTGNLADACTGVDGPGAGECQP